MKIKNSFSEADYVFAVEELLKVAIDKVEWYESFHYKTVHDEGITGRFVYM